MPSPYFECDGVEIYHGDCRDLLSEVSRARVVLITDTPYGIALENHGMVRSNGWDVVAGDEDGAIGRYVAQWSTDRDLPTVMFASPWLPWPGYWPNLIVWDKGEAVGGGGDVATTVKRSWELIQARRVRLRHGRPGGVWRVPVNQAMSSLHPTQKPEALMLRLVATFTSIDDVVVDPCIGSGTTLVAAKRLGRRAIGIELEERYCRVAAQRLAQGVLFGGLEASSTCQ